MSNFMSTVQLKILKLKKEALCYRTFHIDFTKLFLGITSK